MSASRNCLQIWNPQRNSESVSVHSSYVSTWKWVKSCLTIRFELGFPFDTASFSREFEVWNNTIFYQRTLCAVSSNLMYDEMREPSCHWITQWDQIVIIILLNLYTQILKGDWQKIPTYKYIKTLDSVSTCLVLLQGALKFKIVYEHLSQFQEPKQSCVHRIANPVEAARCNEIKLYLHRHNHPWTKQDTTYVKVPWKLWVQCR